MAKKEKKKRPVHAKLICNPGSGDPKDSTARLEEVTRCLLDHGIDVDVALAKPKKRATPIAKKAVKDGYRLVIAMGGDGTIEAVARGLVGSKTRLGIIPTGTYNNVAKSLGIPETLNEACALIEEGPQRKLDVGQAKGKKGGKFYFFEMTVSGLTAALYPDGKTLNKPDAKDRLAHLKDVVETLIHYQTPKFMLKLDGESHIEAESLLVSAANTPVFGMSFMIAPHASLRDGLMDVCLYPNFSKSELIAYFARIANAGSSEDGRVQRYRARKVKIKANPPQDVMADGIMLGQTPVTIRILPGALRIIAPQQAGIAVSASAAAEGLPAPVAPAPSNNNQVEKAQVEETAANK